MYFRKYYHCCCLLTKIANCQIDFAQINLGCLGSHCNLRDRLSCANYNDTAQSRLNENEGDLWKISHCCFAKNDEIVYQTHFKVGTNDRLECTFKK